MATVKIKTVEQTVSTIEIETPAFFKHGCGFKYLIEKDGKAYYHSLIKLFDGTYCFTPILEVTEKTILGDKIEPQQYWDELGKFYDYIGDMLNNIARLSESSIESEEDEPLDESETAFVRSCERADVFNDEQKYKEFEKENFADITSLRNSG